MANSSATPALSDQSPWDVPKIRQCLRCKATFLSDWSGERICLRCKKSSTWRNGARLRPHTVGNRR